MVKIEYDKYKGQDIIVLKEDESDRFGFSFGRRKARLIKQAIDEVLDFADGHETGEKQ